MAPDDNPPPPAGPATTVRIEYRATDEVTHLYARLDDAALKGLLDDAPNPTLTVAVRAAYALAQVDLADVHMLRAWRIRRIVECPGGQILYERTPGPPKLGASGRSVGLDLAMTGEQIEAVLAGAVVHIDPPDGALGLTVRVRRQDREEPS